MTQRSRVLLGLLLAVSLVGASLLIRHFFFERVTEVREIPFTGVAAVNPLLALELLLSSAGIPATSTRGFAYLPAEDQVLLVAAPDRSLGEAGADRLLDWAAAGGHLVVVARPSGEFDEDPLLTPLGVVAYFPPPTAAQLREAAAERRTRGTRLNDEDEGEPERDLALRYLGSSELMLRLGEPGAATLLRLTWGAGVVTVLSDGEVLSNAEIGEDDNALFAWQALVLDPPPAGAQLIYRDRRPSPWAMLAGRAEPVVAALAVLVLAWLWKLAARFGPLLPALEPERRSLAEHVRAAGAWQWDCRAQRTLLDAVRGALHRSLGGGHDEDLMTLALKAAEDQGLDRQRVGEALSDRAPTEEKDFAAVVRTLEELRRSAR